MHKIEKYVFLKFYTKTDIQTLIELTTVVSHSFETHLKLPCKSNRQFQYNSEPKRKSVRPPSDLIEKTNS